MSSPAKLLTFSNWFYCVLLYLYPVPFRREYGYHMAQMFRDDVRGTLRESGTIAVVGLWLLAFFDLLKTAVAEHFWEIFNMPIEKLTRWSGPAAAITGLLFIIMVYGINNGANFTIALGLVFLLMIPFTGLGLFGLYKCLPTTIARLNTLAFTISVVGLLMGNIGTAVQVLWMDNFDNIWITAAGFGLTLSFLGGAGMSIIAMATKALGRWSFAPLLVTAVLMALVSFEDNIDPSTPIVLLVLTIYALSWLLLGVALWQTYKEPQEPGLFA